MKFYFSFASEALELPDTMLDSFDKERRKRAKMQYETTDEIKQAMAETSLKRAKDFTAEIKLLIIRMGMN